MELVLWHDMRYYAHVGHKDFILRLGHRPEVIKTVLPNRANMGQMTLCWRTVARA